MEDREYFIHPSSILEQGAQVGKGTRVWHFCHLMAGSVIGENCMIGQNVFVDRNVQIGNGVKIQNNVSVYDGVALEDDVFVGPSVVFTNVINPRSFISRRSEFRKTKVGKGATVGANATILCGVEIGMYAMVGAGAVVTRSVPDYGLMTGNPARQSGWVSEAGVKLVFNAEGRAVCSETGQVYKIEENRIFPIN